MNRRNFLKGAGLGLAGTGLAALGGYYYGTRIEPQRIGLERVPIPLDSLPEALDGFRIAQLSDFHLFPHTTIELIDEAVRMTNALKPDMVVLTGDFILRTVDSIFELAPVLARLNARHGIFAILGNHDHWRGAGIVKAGLERSGIPLLHNEGLTMVHEGAPFYLAAVDDPWSGRPDLKAALEAFPGGMPLVLLSHAPDPADHYCRDDRISFQISGHSHGGQVRIPGIGAPWLPPFGRKYDLGLYRVGKSWLYTNRGLGVTVPIRLNCPPEVTELTLRAG